MKQFKKYNQSKIIRGNPKGKKIKLHYEYGGYTQIYVNKTKKGFTLCWSGGTENEPIFKIHHNFETLNEVIFYAKWIQVFEQQIF